MAFAMTSARSFNRILFETLQVAILNLNLKCVKKIVKLRAKDNNLGNGFEMTA